MVACVEAVTATVTLEVEDAADAGATVKAAMPAVAARAAAIRLNILFTRLLVRGGAAAMRLLSDTLIGPGEGPGAFVACHATLDFGVTSASQCEAR